MFASEDAIRTLTGYKRPADQIRWLRANGYRFRLSRAGRPVVLESEIERDLKRDGAPAESPDFSIFDEVD